MRRFLLLIALLSPGLLLAADATSTKAKSSPKSADAAPELVSTTGGGKSKWSSVEEIKRAADQGDPAACAEYAILLEQGVQGVTADFPKALAYYTTAAKAGNRQSAFRLGTIYHDGLGVTQDYAKAFAYYQQAAYAGDSLAQYNVGSMLVSARGMKRDWIEGLAWVIVATKNGADADGEKQIRDRLGKQPATIAAAEKRAAQIQAEIGKPRPPAFSELPATPTEPAKLAPAISAPRPSVQMPPPVVVPLNKVTPPPISVDKP
jgi:hypothetical protein